MGAVQLTRQIPQGATIGPMADNSTERGALRIAVIGGGIAGLAAAAGLANELLPRSWTEKFSSDLRGAVLCMRAVCCLRISVRPL